MLVTRNFNCRNSFLFAIIFSLAFAYVILNFAPAVTKFDFTPIDVNCACDLEQEQYDFCYSLQSDRTIKGERFSCSLLPLLRDLLLLEDRSDFVQLPLSPKTLKVAYATAFSSNHFMESLQMLHQFRTFFNHTLIVYDLGLTDDHRSKINTWCNVILRQFHFDSYPNYVQTIGDFRWKPIIIASLLKEFEAVWYMDSSIRWRNTSIAGVHEIFSSDQNHHKSTYLLSNPSDHSPYATTHPNIYKYIPSDGERLKDTENFDAGFAFALRTKQTQEILKWYVACALEKECMAPSGAQLGCNFDKGRYKHYANCHRYDQSTINVILANHFRYNHSLYRTGLQRYVDFEVLRNAVGVLSPDTNCRATK